MAASITSTHGQPHARKPLASQRSAGGDMSIAFFVQPGCPSRFASSDQHRVKGLNAETIARVILPTPPWLAALDYSPLPTDPADPSPSVFFSLNLSIYNQQIVPDDWLDQWFFMAGRVHLFALTWEVELRDQDYQPILPLSLSATDQFPLSSPIVSFTGPIVGPGPALLRKGSVPALDDVQLKWCGFVQLTAFLAPGNPDKTPYRGLHPFQVFVIFPIRANPWASLCKKMTERRDTQFQSNGLLTCTGKVAGLLGHHLMVQPPTLEQDYIFIVVPDSWNFLDKGVSGSGSPTPPPGAATSAIRPSSSASTPGESMPSVISTPSTQYHYLSISPTPKRPTSGVDYTPPAKRPCQPPTSPTTIPSLGTYPSAGSSSSPGTVDEPEPSRGGTQPPTSSFTRPLASATHLPVPTPVLDTIMAAVSESSNRLSRNRHPLKNKYLEEVSKV
ncbi:hypothetical protein BGZ61DRAFT_499473 [Ilyonectria robusta]|uniref:uncharacterized protein n=1 Tax=Ilyonectria robusta TaxID=1079257 RepID=UPI001E8DB75A|nr:uncharacterized protein BGZ61DRAFT_499473 [Ilyonectria robusta]KAH8661809.1 hypothetical protein BGZ61DRAFT_499473 [Ilyonectria robusta]